MAWKIGEVIRRTGLTARTLHFYEQQRLIGPVARTEAGHRLYSQSDLLRLQQIKTLRLLGISLADMGSMLGGDDPLLPKLKRQVNQLRQQRTALQRVEQRVSALIALLEKQSPPSDDLDTILFQSLESMTMYERYFKPSEIDAMHSHEHDAGSGETVEAAWASWVSAMQSALAADADPQSAEVQALMAHWQQLLKHLSGGDEQRLQAFNDLMHNEPQARQEHGISDELFEFMGRASTGH